MLEMPELFQVVEILNRYLTLIADYILKNGGTLDEVHLYCFHRHRRFSSGISLIPS